MAQGFQRAHVYSIPPDVPFLKTLAENILNGRLLPPDFPASNPLALTDITIFLPTRRSAGLLHEIFLSVSPTSSILLPKIRALGEADEEADLFERLLDNSFEFEDVPPAISNLDRHLILTKLIVAWGQAMERHFSGDPLLVPASPADAAWLASDLAELMDRITTEEVSWAELGKLVPEDYASYWQMSLEFLKIATQQWPEILKAHGKIDFATRRDLLLAQEVDRLSQTTAPVIAAGSTGTLPSTARLLAAVARHPHGVLVLPGLDKALADEAFEELGSSVEPATAITGHPQYGLKRLLSDFVRIQRDEVDILGVRDPALEIRSAFVSHAMRPAAKTDDWPQLSRSTDPIAVKAAFAEVDLINAHTDSEEALAIACALREFVETNQNLICLVTPDRALARRVALELKRWNLTVDDSAGRPIFKTAPAVLAQLITEVVASDFDPVSVLSLLKHPLARFDNDPGLNRRAARLLDLAVLRGPRLNGGSKAIARRARALRDELLSGIAQEPTVGAGEKEPAPTDDKPNTGSRLHPAVQGYGEHDWAAAVDLADRLAACLEPLEKVFASSDTHSLAAFAEAHQKAFGAVIQSPSSIKQNNATRALAEHFETLMQETAQSFEITAVEYPKLFRALLGTQTIRGAPDDDPRILILGALEARLVAPDMIILAALDEGSWPRQAETDAFMSRGMRARMGLEAPERRIGLAAHDVTQGLGCRKVILSRAAKRGGSPTIKSRWLQRLLALLGEDISKDLLERGNRHLVHARLLDQPARRLQPAERPNPKPPVAARPRQLSVTRVETWVRDPYAIYADRILNLKPIDALGAMPDFATRGTIVHEALDRFIQLSDAAFDERGYQKLLTIGEHLFQEQMHDFPDQQALWWPRFERIAQAFLAWEAERDHTIQKRYSEVQGKLSIPVDDTSFLLTGTADRIDRLTDNTLAILDFKTGEPPTAKELKAGFSPQLALEVAMQQGGAFDGMAKFSSPKVSSLGWVKLDGRSEKAITKSAIDKPRDGRDQDTPHSLGTLAYQQLIAMIRAYSNPDQGYLSRPRPDFDYRYESPYDHLARVKEWQLADSEGDE